MAVSLAYFTVSFQDEGKSIKRGGKHYKLGHDESFSYSKEELGILVVRDDYLEIIQR